MSTRRYLKNRRKLFKFWLTKEPNKESLKKVIDELDFILEKLKEYDAQKSETTGIC